MLSLLLQWRTMSKCKRLVHDDWRLRGKSNTLIAALDGLLPDAANLLNLDYEPEESGDEIQTYHTIYKRYITYELITCSHGSGTFYKNSVAKLSEMAKGAKLRIFTQKWVRLKNIAIKKWHFGKLGYLNRRDPQNFLPSHTSPIIIQSNFQRVFKCLRLLPHPHQANT